MPKATAAVMLFFFSRRRRHTRFKCDWSSDVCSSDLPRPSRGKWTTYRAMGEGAVDLAAKVTGLPARPCATADLRLHGWEPARSIGPFGGYEIGRASCRERVEISVVAVSLKKKNARR